MGGRGGRMERMEVRRSAQRDSTREVEGKEGKGWAQ